MKTRVIGTAGHIDHGKTSLVRMLTGVDLDTAPEEKARGITIALGFTASEVGDVRIAWVDVPGHERLVRTMIAGATGLDGAVLVVSALEGVMPQTREHLSILQLLGVQHGVVALTMADRVDDELLELAQMDVEEAVEGTFLEGAQVIVTSAVEGRGKDALLVAVAALPVEERAADQVFRLPIDRAFVRPGFGSVITGTAASGTVQDGAQVWLWPSGARARVRGLEVHGHPQKEARAGQRTALNLAGIERADLGRGEVVATTELPCPHVLDVSFSGELEDGQQVRVLSGTAEVLGRLHFASPGFGQLRLDSPLPCMPGDRFILRRTSPMTTLGGGEILDPWARRMRKRDRERVSNELQRLQAGDRMVFLERAGDEGLASQVWAKRGTGGTEIAGRVFAPATLERFRTALVEAVQAYHRSHPLSLGPARRELRRDALGHLPDKVFDAVVSAPIVAEGPRLRHQDFSVQLSPGQRASQAQLQEAIADQGLAGMSVGAVHLAFPDDDTEPLLRLLEDAGSVMQISGLDWVADTSIETVLQGMRAHFDTAELLTPGEFKTLTGLTRKAAIPLLEWCDKQRYTQFNAEGKRARGSQL